MVVKKTLHIMNPEHHTTLLPIETVIETFKIKSVHLSENITSSGRLDASY